MHKRWAPTLHAETVRVQPLVEPAVQVHHAAERQAGTGSEANRSSGYPVAAGGFHGPPARN